MIGEGLLRKGKDGKIEMGLAESMDVSEDGRIYTFKLKESYWSDGKPITAHDFVFSWKTQIHPQSTAPYAYFFYLIENAEQAKHKLSSMESIGIQAIDDQTLKVSLKNPAPFFEELITIVPFFPVQKQEVESPVSPKDFFATQSSGPFRIVHWRNNDEILLEKNPHYWDHKNVHLAGLKLIMVDILTELYLFESGELDWAGSPISYLPADTIPSWIDSSLSSTQASLAIDLLYLNVEKPPLNNRKLRQALSMAINRKNIVTHVTQGGEEPALSVIPLEVRRLKDHELKENENLARQTFQEALDELNCSIDTLPTIMFTFVPSQGNSKKVVQIIQQQWLDVLGLKVELDATERKMFAEMRANGSFMIAKDGWYLDVSDPISMLKVFRERLGPFNCSRWEDTHYSSLLDASENVTSIAERDQYLAEAEGMLIDEVPAIPIFQNSFVTLKNPELEGVVISPLGIADFRWARFVESSKS